ncbi:hypothetical protein B5807_11761 [Epicoccum nigrum]|uniref:Uncharacterized protein n=1 Tax=Epicoccum nigrum TaxID=105696 RepID=A0A1Y2LHX2_EPING|nr:hypothetical protein B5807_11761 [Epicoccum nigrum]
MCWVATLNSFASDTIILAANSVILATANSIFLFADNSFASNSLASTSFAFNSCFLFATNSCFVFAFNSFASNSPFLFVPQARSSLGCSIHHNTTSLVASASSTESCPFSPSSCIVIPSSSLHKFLSPNIVLTLCPTAASTSDAESTTFSCRISRTLRSWYSAWPINTVSPFICLDNISRAAAVPSSTSPESQAVFIDAAVMPLHFVRQLVTVRGGRTSLSTRSSPVRKSIAERRASADIEPSGPTPTISQSTTMACLLRHGLLDSSGARLSKDLNVLSACGEEGTPGTMRDVSAVMIVECTRAGKVVHLGSRDERSLLKS